MSSTYTLLLLTCRVFFILMSQKNKTSWEFEHVYYDDDKNPVVSDEVKGTDYYNHNNAGVIKNIVYSLSENPKIEDKLKETRKTRKHRRHKIITEYLKK